MQKKYFLTYSMRGGGGYEVSRTYYQVSFLQYVCIMTDSIYFVKLAPLWTFIGSFLHFAYMYRYIEDVDEEVWCWKNIFWQIDRVFNLAIFCLHLVNNGW